MDGSRHDETEARYQRSFGVRAGYLPEDRAKLDEWHAKLASKVDRTLPSGLATTFKLADWSAECEHKPSVQKLAGLLDCDPIIRMYVNEMIEQAWRLPDQQHNRGNRIKDVPRLLVALNEIVTTTPRYGTKKSPGIRFPMSALFAYMMMTKAGEAVFRNADFNRALCMVLADWCDYLNSDKSCDQLVDKSGDQVDPDDDGWLSPDAVDELQINEYVDEQDKKKDHWGFTSWNDFFHRKFKNVSQRRPVSCPNDPKVIVSANDGHVYNFASNVKEYDTFWAKGQPYSLYDMLNGQYLDRFINKDGGAEVIQSFLSGNDYHRFMAPIAGTVREVKVIRGLMFSDAESAGFDPHAGVLSQGYEVAVNTRGLVFIESEVDTIGMVCVIPIGITEVSSITLTVKAGEEVNKGDELGYFSFGGSTLCMVFQPGAIDYYTLRAPQVGDPNAGPQGSINSPIKARDRIAIAK